MSSSKLVTAYRHLVNKHLTLYNALQTGVLMAGGDLIAQTVVEKRKYGDINLGRTARFFGLGVILVGPTVSTWYKFLDRRFTSQAGQLLNKKTVLFKKVALDQFVFAPNFIVVILSAINLVEGKSFSDSKSELVAKYPDVLLANYKLWPWVQLINFYYVPLRHQVLVVQIVALLWNTYISYKTHDSIVEESISSTLKE